MLLKGVGSYNINTICFSPMISLSKHVCGQYNGTIIQRGLRRKHDFTVKHKFYKLIYNVTHKRRRQIKYDTNSHSLQTTLT